MDVLVKHKLEIVQHVSKILVTSAVSQNHTAIANTTITTNITNAIAAVNQNQNADALTKKKGLDTVSFVNL
jgi:hypothetical protein